MADAIDEVTEDAFMEHLHSRDPEKPIFRTGVPKQLRGSVAFNAFSDGFTGKAQKVTSDKRSLSSQEMVYILSYQKGIEYSYLFTN